MKRVPLTTYPRILQAANDEFVNAPAARQDNAERQPAASGWDPYEVWRTRVKALQDELNRRPPQR